MLFNSPQFAVFFLIVTFLFFATSGRWQRLVLLLASCIFYMTFVPRYILILFFLIIIDYVAAILIEKRSGGGKKAALLASLFANLGVLFFFKYFNFMNSNLSGLATFLGWHYPIRNLEILLPIGLSFHTFQSMSYTIEVYYGNFKAERNLLVYALYVLFYPQLVAGPIETPQDLIPQIHETHRFEYERVRDGLLLMLVGLLKKMVIADRLAVVVNQVYGDPAQYSGIYLIIATYFFGFQVYCDFSGYTDIARGAAKVMGFNLLENFERPYAAESIPDFWRRWHISLLNWFKRYVFMPIVFSGKRSESRIYLGIFLVFLCSGIWHGASWMFVIWGLLHAFYSIMAEGTQRRRAEWSEKLRLERWPRGLRLWRVFITFHLVTFSWIFFRSRKWSDCQYVLGHIFSGISFTGFTPEKMGTTWSGFITAVAVVVAMEALSFLHSRRPLGEIVRTQPTWMRWGLYYAAIFTLFYLGNVKPQKFIYFQF